MTSSTETELHSAYDFIVVGGGTAGLVLANRLTEDPNTTVLVLEAGSDGLADPRIQVPAMWTAVLGTDLDWDFMTTPQPGLNNRQIGQPQGRVLGGSSAINAENFAPMSDTVFNAWAEFGNSGWGWRDMAPYVRKFYTLHAPDEAIAKHHRISWIDEKVRGTNGPIQASFSAMPGDPLGQAWVDSLTSLGYDLKGDPFAGSATGPWSQVASIDPETKTRSYSASAYWRPIMESRKNLTVVTNATVQKIVVEADSGSHRATGISAKLGGSNNARTILASKEVLLAAGAFQSPKLLELSGIGKGSVLKSHGISTLVDLPGVGENLQDHIMTGFSYEAADGVMTGDPLLRQEPEMLQMAMQMYQEQKAGPLAMGSLSSFAYLPILQEFHSDPEDFEQIIKKNSPSSSASELEKRSYDYLHRILSSPTEASAALFVLPAQVNLHNGPKQVGMVSGAKAGSYISIGAGLAHPLSRGSSHISSTNPDAPPTIDPRYLSHPLDMEIYARHLLAVERIAATPPLSQYIKQDGVRAQPGNPKIKTVDEAAKYIRETALTNNHPVGTCAMLPRQIGGVVDDKLRVYGLQGLRVVDASVMPLIPRGNTQTAVYAVAEKAADLIKAAHGLAEA